MHCTFYQLSALRTSMSDDDLLGSLFVQQGMRQGLEEQLLKEILTVLVRDQFIPQGKRSTVQAELERLVKRYLQED